MKTQEELQHEADKQKRSDEITLLLEWPDDVTRHSGDGGESYSAWDRERQEEDLLLDAIEDEHRNRREDEKERIEKEWYENERSRAATADNYWNEELDYE